MARGAIAYKGQLYLGGSKVEANPTGSATGGNLSKLGVDDTVYAIPQANNGTLTIQKNGTNVATFSANQSENVTANIDVSEDIAGTQTATGNPLTLTNVAPINAESLVVELEPKQEGSGDPSPTNIRPITGYTQTSVEGVGKNLFDKSSVISGGFNADGTVYESAADSRRVGGYIAVEPSTEYYISNAVPLAAGRTGFWYDENKTSISQITFPSTVQTSGAVTSPNNAKYIRLCVPSSTLDTAQIEKGSTATQYEPYHSSNATIQFGQTVYGADVNVSDGGTDVKKGKYACDGTETVAATATANIYRISVGFMSDFVAVGATPMCSHYKGVPYSGAIANMNDGECCVYEGQYGRTIAFKDTSIASAEDFEAFLLAQHTAGKPVEISLPLNTETKISTPPTPLPMLKGTNNLSADGVMQIGYQPDNSIGDAVKASEEYTDRRMDALGDLAYINEDGDNSTKFLRGDGTWQNTPAGVTTLAALTDTTISSPSNGQVLKYDGSKWVNSADYSLPTASAGTLGGVKVGANLSIDANGVLSATGGGANALNDLTDVSAASPSNKQVLAYDSSQSKWVAVDADVVAIPRSYWSSTTRELDFMITVPAYNTQRILKFSLMHAAGLAASEYMFALDRGDVYSSKMAGDTCGISYSYSSSTYTYTITITMPSVSGSPNFIFAMTMYNGSDKTW